MFLSASFRGRVVVLFSHKFLAGVSFEKSGDQHLLICRDEAFQ